MARLITWERVVGVLITGRSISSGNEVIRSTAAFTSLRARSTSVSVMSSTATTALPSAAVLRTSLTPSRPRTASSTARMTPCSTSSGLAPG